MSAVDQALETQLSNIEAKTGKSRTALGEEILAQGLSKHGEMVKWVKETWGLGHGDANTLVHVTRKAAEGEETTPLLIRWTRSMLVPRPTSAPSMRR